MSGYRVSIDRNMRHQPGLGACIAWLVLLSLIFAPTAVNASGHVEDTRTNQIKAAFILNIARFVAWPDGGDETQGNNFTLCSYRSNPLGDALEELSNKTVSGRALIFAEIKHLDDANCKVLLIPDTEIDRFLVETGKLTHHHVLTIADLTAESSRGLPLRGVQVALVRKQASIGFEVNIHETERAGLKMSSELLKLAHVVGRRK